ncbi:thioesterase-like protein [Arthrobacter crystallopoietes BAB-32]|uniref:Thioesterase-like protein n=1 Tax=Arthrobacter crystallopoietes BAB-32 TaxID=1246476 RepID=N1VAT6_9MICC|nr:thioesterase family protein [Arthrobacter crystallopoietes]EMY35418.1 thioesterase-like protein [Arthrobacter crystallopoietes BAB-32]
MSALAAGTLQEYRCRVQPEWIDYNGHMSEAFYVLVFGYATDQVMEQLGLDDEYRRSSGCSLYTVEAHIRYLAETGVDAELSVVSRIVGAGAKKLHLAHEMRSGETLIATEELLALHVDQQSGRSTAFTPSVMDTITGFLPAQGEPAPEWTGRKVSS